MEEISPNPNPSLQRGTGTDDAPATEAPNAGPNTYRSRIMAAIQSAILPKKKSDPSILSASRAPAAEALSAANYVEVHEESPRAPERLTSVPATTANALPDVPALHTYKGDVASTIENQRISLATIAQAEAAKRAHEPVVERTSIWQRIGVVRAIEVVFGLILIAAAAGVLGWSYLRLRPLPPVASTQAPFITADQIAKISVSPSENRSTLMSDLQSAVTATLPIGIIEQLSLTVSSSTPGITAPMSTRQFFESVAPQAPDALIRSLKPQFLLGVYAADGNQPFLLFKTDSYEQAFAGMLAWEYVLPRNLAPLFPQLPEQQPAATTSTSTTADAGEIFGSPFTDALIDNHDARVIRDAEGNVALLWSFVDRQTLVITTSADTLTQIVSRLQKAPVITIPGQ